MRNTTWTIIKKELYRFFRNKKMILTAIILPAVLTYAMFALAGKGAEEIEKSDMPVFQCYVQHMPESFKPILDEYNFEVTEVTDLEEARKQVMQKNAELLLIFPDDFEQQLQILGTNWHTPNIEAYYNSTSMDSEMAYEFFTSAVSSYEDAVFNVLDINRDVIDPDLASDKDISSFHISTLLPTMLVITLLFACTSFSTESISGEKERGTIATLLVTPARRTSIAIGKIVSLSILALLSGLAQFISCLFSFRKLPGDLIKMDAYGFREYAGFLAVIITTVLLMVAILSIISAYAKNVKEANSMSTPILLVTAFSGLLTSIPLDFSAAGWKLIPVFNSLLCMTDIFAFNYTVSGILITCISNLIYTIVLGVILSGMFSSEKIMFNK